MMTPADEQAASVSEQGEDTAAGYRGDGTADDAGTASDADDQS